MAWSIGAALMVQERPFDAETMALLRAVISEQDRFPDLASVTYRAAIGHVEEFLASLLAGRSEAAHLDEAARRARLRSPTGCSEPTCSGSLLGLAGRDAAARQSRAELAADDLLAALARS
ncbi:MAG: TetR/AcrR family transcriptional regulator C-terminal domain-containing protein [Bauldia sp.]